MHLSLANKKQRSVLLSELFNLLHRAPSDHSADISQVYTNTSSQLFPVCAHVSVPNCHTAPQPAVLTQLEGWGQEFLKLALPLQKCLAAPHPPAAWEKGYLGRWQEGEPGVSNQHITKALWIPGPTSSDRASFALPQTSCKYLKFPKLISWKEGKGWGELF